MSQSGLKKIKFLPSGVEIEGDEEKSLLQLAVENQIPINHSCGGGGSCGTCLIKVVEGLELLAEREFPEKEMAEDRGFSAWERLACQTPAYSGLVVEVAFVEET